MPLDDTNTDTDSLDRSVNAVFRVVLALLTVVSIQLVLNLADRHGRHRCIAAAEDDAGYSGVGIADIEYCAVTN